MATLTLKAKFAMVHVIIDVATTAGIGHFQYFGHRQPVALIAAQFAMCAVEFEIGFVVVKIPSLPVAHVVARFA